MNQDILGMLFPMLLKGSDVMEVLRRLGGSGVSAANIDGLEGMMNAQMKKARRDVPLRPTQELLSTAAEDLVDRMGVVPYSGLGQGLSELFGAMYNISPDVFGSILGVPNFSKFFSTVANGASGIEAASGFGMLDVMNPYSVMESHRRTMQLARQAHELGLEEKGGYRISYGHGLNMDEMGKVAQRLLSSDIPYMEYANTERFDPNVKSLTGTDMGPETGRRLDISKEGDKFKDNLDKLGSKFNEAVATLSKMTGSVEEALNIMDRMAGGNFLGGSEAQASQIAARAKSVAAAVRVTAAMSGMTPQEVYSNAVNMQNNMVAGLGVDVNVANGTGFSSIVSDISMSGALAYSTWTAMNPRATPVERQRALIAATGTVQSYATSNGAALAAAIADNEDKFTTEELSRFEEAFRSGRPNDIVGVVRDRLGANAYNDYISDPSTIAAAKVNASRFHKNMYDRMNQAGLEGNLKQAEMVGAKAKMDKALLDIGTHLEFVSKDVGFAGSQDKALKAKFMELAAKEGFEGGESMTVNELREFLLRRPGMDGAELARIENRTLMEDAVKQIDLNTVSEEEEVSANFALSNAIQGSEWSDEAKKSMESRIAEGGLDEVFEEFSSSMSAGDRLDLYRRVYGGKLSRKKAREMKGTLENLYQSQEEYTLEERMVALENRVGRFRLEHMGDLKGYVLSEDISNALTSGIAISNFNKKVKELQGQGILYAGVDDSLAESYDKAAQRMVSGIVGTSLGKLDDEGTKEFVSAVSDDMMTRIRKGESVHEAFAGALSAQANARKDAIGSEGMEFVETTIADANDKGSNLRKRKLGMGQLLTGVSSVIDETTEAFRGDAVREMRLLSEGKGELQGMEAVGRFLSLAESTGVVSGDISELESMASAVYDRTSDTRAAIGAILGQIQKDGTRDNSFYAMSAAKGATQATVIMAASMAKLAGLDMKRLDLGPEFEDVISKLDDVTADSSLNRIQNAIRAGSGSYSREAIDSTKKDISALGNILRDSDVVSADTVRAASGSGEGAAKARKDIEDALRKAHRVDIKRDMALLETISGAEIGGYNVLDAAIQGEEAIGKAYQSAGDDANSQIAGIAKETGRKDSTAYEVMKPIADVLSKLGEFMADPSSMFKTPIGVTITNDAPIAVEGW